MSSQQSPSDQRIQLETLQVSELAILLGHLQLGIDHLKKHLNKDQLAELLNYGDINSRQYEILKPDEIERHGNIASRTVSSVSRNARMTRSVGA